MNKRHHHQSPLSIVPLSPVVGHSDFASASQDDDPPTPLRPYVETDVGDRGGTPAEFAVVVVDVG